MRYATVAYICSASGSGLRAPAASVALATHLFAACCVLVKLDPHEAHQRGDGSFLNIWTRV